MLSHKDSATLQLHASSVAIGGCAVLILGDSGTGKSTLALQLMAFGAGLIADDRTDVTERDGQLIAACPETIAGRIEARGIGLLSVSRAAAARIVLAVDMGRVERARMPPERSLPLLGQSVRLLHRVEGLHFAPAILHLLTAAATGT